MAVDGEHCLLEHHYRDTRRGVPRIVLMGLPIHRVGEAQVISFILEALEREHGGWMITANLDQLRQFRSRPELRHLFEHADLIVADGMPLVWASRLQRTPLPERVAGSELIWTLSAQAAAHGRSVYLLGDVPQARRMAERRLRARYPALRIAGSYSPPVGFEHDSAELGRIRDRLLAAHPDIVYVALGFPKQEQLIAQLRAELGSTWFIGVGISLSFAGGYVKRAPPWVARAGFEWAHRLLQEPRRLAKRYVIRGLPFAARLFAHALAMRALRWPHPSHAQRSDDRWEELPVTAVIPVYRRPEMVERAIRSVRAQHRPPAEVIVVDDGSGDDTAARAQNLGARVIAHDRNLGRGASRNTGLRAATHGWVALLDSDDEWLPSHLDTLWAARDGHLLVGTAALVRSPGEKPRRTYGWAGRRRRTLRGPADIAVPENKLVTSAVMLHRQAALEAGGFRTDMPRAEDLDLWVRMLKRGSALAVPCVTAIYHAHPNQVSADAAPMWTAHRAVLDGQQALPGSVRRRAEGILAWDAARAARAGGAPAARTAISLARQLASPQSAVGVVQLLASRRRARRLAGRFGPGGHPSLAILPGARVPSGPRPDVDLRGHSFAGALLHLLRRPPAQAVVPGPAAGLAVRMFGIEPVIATQERAQPLA